VGPCLLNLHGLWCLPTRTQKHWRCATLKRLAAHWDQWDRDIDRDKHINRDIDRDKHINHSEDRTLITRSGINENHAENRAKLSEDRNTNKHGKENSNYVSHGDASRLAANRHNEDDGPETGGTLGGGTTAKRVGVTRAKHYPSEKKKHYPLAKLEAPPSEKRKNSRSGTSEPVVWQVADGTLMSILRSGDLEGVNIDEDICVWMPFLRRRNSISPAIGNTTMDSVSNSTAIQIGNTTMDSVSISTAIGNTANHTSIAAVTAEHANKTQTVSVRKPRRRVSLRRMHGAGLILPPQLHNIYEDRWKDDQMVLLAPKWAH
jgi:hypothetical protein